LLGCPVCGGAVGWGGGGGGLGGAGGGPGLSAAHWAAFVLVGGTELLFLHTNNQCCEDPWHSTSSLVPGQHMAQITLGLPDLVIFVTGQVRLLCLPFLEPLLHPPPAPSLDLRPSIVSVLTKHAQLHESCTISVLYVHFRAS
jgi:hypothetical protein